MPEFVNAPTVIESVGNLPKRIEEYVGRVNTGEESLSVARMVSPGTESFVMMLMNVWV